MKTIEHLMSAFHDYVDFDRETDREIAKEKALIFMCQHADFLLRQSEWAQESDLCWYEENSRKLGELNTFLQERYLGNVGDHVINVVMKYVEDLEMLEQTSDLPIKRRFK